LRAPKDVEGRLLEEVYVRCDIGGRWAEEEEEEGEEPACGNMKIIDEGKSL
jgi:hypothetical protein